MTWPEKLMIKPVSIELSINFYLVNYAVESTREVFKVKTSFETMVATKRWHLPSLVKDDQWKCFDWIIS